MNSPILLPTSRVHSLRLKVYKPGLQRRGLVAFVLDRFRRHFVKSLLAEHRPADLNQDSGGFCPGTARPTDANRRKPRQPAYSVKSRAWNAGGLYGELVFSDAFVTN